MTTTTLEHPEAVDAVDDHEALFPAHCGLGRLEGLVEAMLELIEREQHRLTVEQLLYVTRSELARLKVDIDAADETIGRLVSAAKGV
jgi:hypothetical protein